MAQGFGFLSLMIFVGKSKEIIYVMPNAHKLPRIDGSLVLKKPASPVGKCTIQVMRSASKTLQQMEVAAKGQKQTVESAQNNCLKAMLKAISNARHFIYIEGQFFQTAHGHSGPVQAGLSGPMSKYPFDQRNCTNHSFHGDVADSRG